MNQRTITKRISHSLTRRAFVQQAAAATLAVPGIAPAIHAANKAGSRPAVIGSGVFMSTLSQGSLNVALPAQRSDPATQTPVISRPLEALHTLQREAAGVDVPSAQIFG